MLESPLVSSPLASRPAPSPIGGETQDWSGILVWADFATAIAIAAIALMLVIFALRRRTALPAGWATLATGLLLASSVAILLHSLSTAGTAISPEILAWSRALAAATGCAAVLVSIIALPVALEPASEDAHAERLALEIERRRQAEADLLHARDESEEQRARVVARERRLRAAMAAAGVCAVRWDWRTNRIEWDAGAADALEALELPASSRFASWEDLLTPEDADRLRAIATEAAESRRPLALELLARAELGAPRRIYLSARAEAQVFADAGKMTGIFVAVRGEPVIAARTVHAAGAMLLANHRSPAHANSVNSGLVTGR